MTMYWHTHTDAQTHCHFCVRRFCSCVATRRVGSAFIVEESSRPIMAWTLFSTAEPFETSDLVTGLVQYSVEQLKLSDSDTSLKCRLFSPCVLCASREDGDPENYTLLELLMSLTTSGWKHRLVDTWRHAASRDPLRPEDAELKFYTEVRLTSTPTLRFYMLALSNQKRLWHHGVEEVCHGASCAYYKALIYAPRAGIKPGKPLAYYKKLIEGVESRQQTPAEPAEHTVTHLHLFKPRSLGFSDNLADAWILQLAHVGFISIHFCFLG